MQNWECEKFVKYNKKPMTINKWRWTVTIAEMQRVKLQKELANDSRLAPWLETKINIVLDNYRLAVEELLSELRE
jgi:hypothetical protein